MSEVAQVLQRDAAMSKLMTPGGKSLQVFHIKNTSLYGVSFTDGGELPGELRGRFTSGSRARKAIEGYLNKMWTMNDEVVEKNAKAQERKQKSAEKKAEATDGKTES